jgi:hypothetical protein
VHALLWGLHDALREEREGDAERRDSGPSFPWRPVLDLCRWVLDQPRRDDEEQYVGGRDVGWGPTLREGAALLRDGLLKEHELPFGLRAEVWEVLERLADDPEPTKEYEEEAARKSRPPLTPNHFSINTVRGVAAHAVMSYAFWVRRNVVEGEPAEMDEEQGRWHGFDDAPEAQALLERRLDPVAEPTRTVRSVYGTWLPTLVSLDRGWVEAKLPEIFPRDDALAYLRDAAWEAYVAHGSPYDEVFELLRKEYDRAIGQLAERHAARDGERRRSDPDRSLAEHLMILSWRGTLGVDEPNGLLERFYLLAPEDLRAHAAGFVGRALRNQDPSPEALARLEDLWERRLENAAEDEGRGFSEELGAFSWWFVSGKIEDEVALERLERTLTLGGDVGRDAYLVVKRLAVVAPKHTRLAVRCLQKIVDKILAGDQRDRWRILAIDDALVVLKAALSGGDEDGGRTARETANILVANGYESFRELV